MNSFEFFEKIFCINLDERKDRWEKCLENFDKLEILHKVERFPGIKFTHNDEKYKKFLGRAGCSLSHFEILKNAKNNNLSNYLVLEDDFELAFEPKIILNNLDESIKEMPEDWDIFYLGGNLDNSYNIDPISKYSNHLFKLNSCHTTHSFAVNNRFYDLFLKNAPDVKSIFNWVNDNEVIDVFLSKKILRNNNCFISNPMLFVQAASFSDIEGGFYDYRNWLKNNFEHFKNSI
jgi:glycosyl transferase family 25